MRHSNKDIEKLCVLCEHSTVINDDENVLCDKHGIVLSTYHCRSFSYDPLKRIPPKIQVIAPLEYIDIDDGLS